MEMPSRSTHCAPVAAILLAKANTLHSSVMGTKRQKTAMVAPITAIHTMEMADGMRTA